LIKILLLQNIFGLIGFTNSSKKLNTLKEINMAYNKKLDITHFEADIVGDNDTLKVSVNSYNGGERKLQIGPRIFEKKNGDEGFRKAGRMTAEEYAQLKDLLSEIEEALLG